MTYLRLHWLLWVVLAPLVPFWLPLIHYFFQGRGKEWRKIIIDGDLVFSSIAINSITLSGITVTTPDSVDMGWHMAGAIFSIFVSAFILGFALERHEDKKKRVNKRRKITNKRIIGYSFIVVFIAIWQNVVITF